MSLNISLSHSRSLKVIRNDTLCSARINPYQYSIETMSISRTVSEIFSVKWRNLKIWVTGRSRSLNMTPFDRPDMTSYWSAIVSIALSCTVFELFDYHSLNMLRGHSRSLKIVYVQKRGYGFLSHSIVICIISKIQRDNANSRNGPS